MVFSIPFFEQKLADRFEVGDEGISYFLGASMVFCAFKSTDPLRISREVLQRWRDAENSTTPAPRPAGEGSIADQRMASDTGTRWKTSITLNW